jgi:hypothetical protein
MFMVTSIDTDHEFFSKEIDAKSALRQQGALGYLNLFKKKLYNLELLSSPC